MKDNTTIFKVITISSVHTNMNINKFININLGYLQAAAAVAAAWRACNILRWLFY